MTGEQLITYCRKLAAVWQKKYNQYLDSDSIESEAVYAGFIAYSRFDPNRGVKLTSWIYSQVWYALSGAYRERRRKKEKEKDSITGQGFSPQEFLYRLGEDSQRILSILWDRSEPRTDWKICAWKREIASLGWPNSRLHAALKEIEAAYWPQA